MKVSDSNSKDREGGVHYPYLNPISVYFRPVTDLEEFPTKGRRGRDESWFC